MKHILTVLGALTVTKELQPGVYNLLAFSSVPRSPGHFPATTSVSTAGFPLILSQSPQIDEILPIGAAIAQLGFSNKKSV